MPLKQGREMVTVLLVSPGPLLLNADTAHDTFSTRPLLQLSGKYMIPEKVVCIKVLLSMKIGSEKVMMSLLGVVVFPEHEMMNPAMSWRRWRSLSLTDHCSEKLGGSE